jgi:acyl-CoA thioesterase YciA
LKNINSQKNRKKEKGKNPMENKDPAIRTIMLPRDTNGAGTIFGGVILSYIDLAGSVEARRQSKNIQMMATVAMDKIEFIAPVFVGDIVSFYTKTLRIGRTSICVQVDVEASREQPSESAKVTTAQVTYVSVHPTTRRPVPLFPEKEEQKG